MNKKKRVYYTDNVVNNLKLLLVCKKNWVKFSETLDVSQVLHRVCQTINGRTNKTNGVGEGEPHLANQKDPYWDSLASKASQKNVFDKLLIWQRRIQQCLYLQLNVWLTCINWYCTWQWYYKDFCVKFVTLFNDENALDFSMTSLFLVVAF